MSGHLLVKQSSGLVARSFQHLRAGATGGLPVRFFTSSSSTVIKQHTLESPLLSVTRNFSIKHHNYDNVSANIAEEQNDAILKIRAREARKTESLDGEIKAAESDRDSHDNTEEAGDTSVHESNTQSEDVQQKCQQPNSDDDDTMSPSAAAQARAHKKTSDQKESAPGNILDRLRKLSMTDMSRYSEVKMGNERPKDPPRHFDARLLKVLAVKNKLKHGGRGGDYGQNNYNNYDRPNYNRREAYDDDEEFDAPRQMRPAQRFSRGGPPPYNDRDRQRRRNRSAYDDDFDDDDDDIDFDASRRMGRSNESSRLAEQAQIRRGGASNAGVRRPSEEDNDDYEEIVRNRFANRRETSRTTSGHND